jgi:hypothetical protein
MDGQHLGSHIQQRISERHTVNTLLIGKSLALLCFIPFDDQPISKRQSGSGVRGPRLMTMHLVFLPKELCPRVMGSYDSSQLNNERARVVSTCFTTSRYRHRSRKPFCHSRMYRALPRIRPYPRSRSQTSVRVPLVPSYQPCITISAGLGLPYMFPPPVCKSTSVRNVLSLPGPWD